MPLVKCAASSRIIRCFCLVGVFVLSLLRLPSAAAEPASRQDRSRQQPTESVDQRTNELHDRDSAEEVAREVLRLQQQLGGSVVDQSRQLTDFHDPISPRSTFSPTAPTPQSAVPAVPLGRMSPYSTEVAPQAIATDLRTRQKPVSKVTKLREAAWQLDTTANCLENLDLYDQADALRGLSSRLRRDAREMKQQATNAAIELSSFELPKQH